jgi:glycosyltransferase involved in cell wall biosynthesis
MSKKVIYCSNASFAKTGFGIHSRTILSYLYKKGYEIIEYAAGYKWDDMELKKLPWKAHGTIPNNEGELDYCRRDPSIIRNVQYGSHCFNKLLKENPNFDALIACEDVWGVEHIIRRDYFDEINDRTMVITPVDSLPLLPSLVELTPKIKNIYVKAPFAQEELKKIGNDHVKYMPVLIDNSQFFPIGDERKKEVRKLLKIDEDTFIIGFCFRNQSRKLVLTLLEAFALFKKKNPKAKAKVFLHTNFGEGACWDIPRATEYFGINPEDVITTYICKNCHKIMVSPFKGDQLGCSFCKTENGLKQTTPDFGCDEEELNVLFNMMDFYAQVVNSGGFECPSLQALLAGIPSCATPYAGTKQFTDSGFVVPIKSSLDRFEEGSGFRKAQPCPKDLAKIISRFYFMPKEEREAFGMAGRDYAVKTFDSEKYCEEIYQWVESLPKNEGKTNYTNERNEKFEFPVEDDTSKFVTECYKGILNMRVDSGSEDVKRIVSEISETDDGKMKFYNKLIDIAKYENKREKGLDIGDFIKDHNKKKLLYIIPCSIGDILSSLSVIDSLYESYPKEEWDIYASSEPKYLELFDHLIGDKLANVLPYEQALDHYEILEGAGEHKGHFDVVFYPYLSTQRSVAYIHNGADINKLQPIRGKYKTLSYNAEL